MGRPQESRGRAKKEGKKRRGPRLPASLRRELNLSSAADDHHDEEEGGVARLPADIYEYEEDDAPEDTQKNHRYDDVDRLEFELPSDFEDEEIEEEAAYGDEVTNQANKKRPQEKINRHGVSRIREKLANLHSDEDEDEEEPKEVEEEDEYDEEEDEEQEEEEADHQEAALAGEEEEAYLDGKGAALASEEEKSSESEPDNSSDDERHRRMIKAVKGTRTQDDREKKLKRPAILSEAYPESEFNINPPINASNSEQITVDDLMTTLQGTTGFGSLRKRMQQLQKNAVVVDAPLPKVVQERLNRQAGYAKTSEEISKWQDIVKKNRELPTLVFTRRPNLSAVSTAELASKFEPTTELEKEVASLLQESGFANGIDTVNSLGFNKLTVAEVKERQERFAKMRNSLFYHEAKAKRMKKIKSKAFHRVLQKERKHKSRLNGVEDELDPEALQEAALKTEFRRAEERMTLKHKNTSRWAKRIIERGLKAKDDGSRDAIAEQLRTHAALTRKVHSANNASSSEDSSDDEGSDPSAYELGNDALAGKKPRERVLAKAKVEALKVLEGDMEAEFPSNGLFSLPFMARAIEKKRKQAQNEALAVLEQLEQLGGNEGDSFTFEDSHVDAGAMSGRLGFGSMANMRSVDEKANAHDEEPEMLVEEGSSDDDKHEDRASLPKLSSSKRKRPGVSLLKRKPAYDISSSERTPAIIVSSSNRKPASNDGVTKSVLVRRAPQEKVFEEPSSGDGLFKGELPKIDNPWLFGDVNEGSVARKASDYDSARTLKKPIEGRIDNLDPLVTSVGSVTLTTLVETRANLEIKDNAGSNGGGSANAKPSHTDELRKAAGVSSSSWSDDEEVENCDIKKGEGFGLFTGNESQAELIRRAFAGDNVEADFEEMKEQVLNQEAPTGEASVSLPGWGQWSDIQKKQGQPLWMLKEQEELKKKRETALNKRKDSKLKYVIVSEKTDKKAEKFTTPSLPFPYDSRKMYERSIRMPIGREYNTDQAFRDMTRPSVLKDAGIIIDPIKYRMSETKHGDGVSLPEDKSSKKRSAETMKRGGSLRLTKSRKVSTGEHKARGLAFSA